ncbi:LysR family transcriptional regulator [Photobacterium sanctipauli]|uniref:LysR family transcriptional regulator n=1 Tax=Photobacterium sanctipauli TaxID=1342794 RepID=A0A2T3NWE3_9GAMM|nr:LysR family transcriptional regulator [Photobacterium sanctipauli]PSW20566.1 LysR family transcriptional regulator [Photobacterium sanctipauli]
MQQTLDPILLKSLVAVVDTGSFTRAAESTHLTQSTISQQVKKLEAQLGCELLSRNKRHTTATLEGERVVTYARRILDMMEEAVAQTAIVAEQRPIRLGVPEDFATHELMPTLTRFAKAFPDVRLEVKSGMCSDIWTQFQNLDLDLALVKHRLGTAQGEACWSEPLCWIDGKHANSLEQDTVPLVGLPSTGLYRSEMAHTFDSLGKKWRMAYITTSLSGVGCAVEAGLGISLLPKRLVTQQHRVLGEKQGLPNVSPLELWLHVGPQRSSQMKLLAEYLTEACDGIFAKNTCPEEG